MFNVDDGTKFEVSGDTEAVCFLLLSYQLLLYYLVHLFTDNEEKEERKNSRDALVVTLCNVKLASFLWIF